MGSASKTLMDKALDVYFRYAIEKGLEPSFPEALKRRVPPICPAVDVEETFSRRLKVNVDSHLRHAADLSVG